MPTPPPSRSQHDKAQQSGSAQHPFSDISGNNGRCQDLRDAYSALKAEYSQVGSARTGPIGSTMSPCATIFEIEKWQRRGEMFQSGTRGWINGKDLPEASALGLPAARTAPRWSPAH